jgi:hypothetical protein
MLNLFGQTTLFAMLIRDDKTLGELQREFSAKFPFLRLRFFENENMRKSQKKLDSSRKIGEVRDLHNEGEVSIHGKIKVKNLEETLANEFGLYAQVFRLSGNLWLQTTSTDEWTLHEQNRKGGSSASHYKEKYEL